MFHYSDNNLDILTYSPNAKVTLSNVVYRRDACLVSQLAVPILLSTPRPKDCLGTQQAGSISWCDPSSKLCWYNITHQYNFCSFASNTLSPEIDDTGGYEGEIYRMQFELGTNLHMMHNEFE